MLISFPTRVGAIFSSGGGEAVFSTVRILLAPLCDHCFYAPRTIPSVCTQGCPCTHAWPVRVPMRAAVRRTASLSARSRPQEHVATIFGAVIPRPGTPKDGMGAGCVCPPCHPFTNMINQHLVSVALLGWHSLYIVSPGTPFFRERFVPNNFVSNLGCLPFTFSKVSSRENAISRTWQHRIPLILLPRVR